MLQTYDNSKPSISIFSPVPNSRDSYMTPLNSSVVDNINFKPLNSTPIMNNKDSYTPLNPTFNPETSEKRDCDVLGAVFWLLIGGLIGGAIVASSDYSLNPKARTILNNKKSASLIYNPNNSTREKRDYSTRGLEVELRESDELYNNGPPPGVAGPGWTKHVPDTTGRPPWGTGRGGGEGEQSGKGIEGVLQWLLTPKGELTPEGEEWLRTPEGQEWLHTVGWQEGIPRTAVVSNYNKSKEYIKAYDIKTKEGIRNNEKADRSVEGGKKSDLEGKVSENSKGEVQKADDYGDGDREYNATDDYDKEVVYGKNATKETLEGKEQADAPEDGEADDYADQEAA